jgi:hypothetical protein
MSRILDLSSIEELIGTIEICKRHNLPLNADECDWIIDALVELHGNKSAWKETPPKKLQEVKNG